MLTLKRTTHDDEGNFREELRNVKTSLEAGFVLQLFREGWQNVSGLLVELRRYEKDYPDDCPIPMSVSTFLHAISELIDNEMVLTREIY